MDCRERQVLKFQEAYDEFMGSDEEFPLLKYFDYDIGNLLYALNGYADMIREQYGDL